MNSVEDEMFVQARQMIHPKERPLSSRSARTRLTGVNLLRFFLLFAVFLVFNDLAALDKRQHRQQVHAARVNGVIYNKNGKFIYRPSRSSQAHIIIIDDRGAKKESQKEADQPRSTNTTAENQVDPNVKSPIGVNGQSSLMQMLPSGSRFAPMMRSIQSVLPFNLMNSHGGQSAESGIPNKNNRIYDNALQPAVSDRMTPQTNSDHLPMNSFPLASFRVVPVIQFIPQTGSSPPPGALIPAAFDYDRSLSATAANMAAVQRNQQKLETASSDHLLLNPLFQSTRESPDYDGTGKSLQDSYYRAQMVPTTRGDAGRLSDTLNDDLKQPQYSSAYPRPELLFDEPMQQPLRNYPVISPGPVQQPHEHQIARSRTGGALSSQLMVQDLDDVEGDHIEYYRMGMGGRSGGAIGSRASHPGQYERLSNRHHSRHSPALDAPLGGETYRAPAISRLLNESQGSAMQLNQTQPLPSSIQSIKSQLKRSNPSSSSHRSRSRKPSGSPTRDDETINLEPASGSLTTNGAARDPKSLQYWKQYQDQFDII